MNLSIAEVGNVVHLDQIIEPLQNSHSTCEYQFPEDGSSYFSALGSEKSGDR